MARTLSPSRVLDPSWLLGEDDFVGAVADTHPNLGGTFDESVTGGTFDTSVTGGEFDQSVRSATVRNARGGRVTEPVSGGNIDESVTGGEVY